MLGKAILVGLVGVIGIWDTRLFGNLKLERPLILGTLTGLVLGDLKTGVILGAALELVFMGAVAIGAAAPPDMILGSVIATAICILQGGNVGAALTIAVPIAALGTFVATAIRIFLAQLGHSADKLIDEGQYKAAQRVHVILGPFLYGLLYFVLIFAAIYFGAHSVGSIIQMIPQNIQDALSIVSKVLPALGFAMILRTMVTKEMVVYFLLGFAIVAYSKIDLIGMSIIAVLLALILLQTRSYSEKG